MSQVILAKIDSWYNEPTQGGDRPKLLSKLAVIELCGWIEGRFDQLLMVADSLGLQDATWIKTNIVDKTHGFSYNEHFRPALCRIVGEHSVRRIELDLETNNPGEIEKLKSALGSLWKQRCSFAHADISANIASQQTFYAPSWSINQFRIIEKGLSKYEKSIRTVLT